MKKIIFVLFAFSLVIINKDIAKAEELPSDVIKKFGFTDEQIINVDDYEYHFIVSPFGQYIYHLYSDVPIKIQYEYWSSSHILHVTNSHINYIAYEVGTDNIYINQSASVGMNIFRFNDTNFTKEDILYHNWLPEDYTTKPGKIFYVGGSTGILVADNTLEDLGYYKDDVFFFQGNYTPETVVSPTEPGDDEPDEPTPPGGLDDDDRGWLSGLFSGISESISGLTGSIIEGVTTAFQSVGQFILDGIKNLFLPSEGFFGDKIDGIKDKFSFVDSIKESYDDFLLVLEDTTDEVPKISINLSNVDSKYNYGDTALALDMSWYADFKPFVDVIIIAFAYLGYMFLVYKRLPDIINGAGAITTTVSKGKK